VDKLSDEVAAKIKELEYFSPRNVVSRWEAENAAVAATKPTPEEREQRSVSWASREDRAEDCRKAIREEGLEKMAEVRPVVMPILARFVEPLEKMYDERCAAVIAEYEALGMTYRVDDVTWSLYAELQKLKARLETGFSKDSMMSPWNMLAPFVRDETPSPTQS